ncbi:MAG: EamA family transporter [Anaerolineales bacterium]|nr:EamA family transporter [Anaerolineales bacterium]
MINPSGQQVRSYLALGSGVLCLGFSAIFIRWAGAPGAVASFYRVGIAAVAMAIPFYRRTRRNGRLPQREVRIALLGGVLFAADLALWATGVMLSGATNPTLLANTAPLWVGVGAFLFFRERRDTKFWGGLVLAMIGAVVVLGLDAIRATSLGLGTLFGLLAGFFYGSYILVTQRARERLDSLSSFWLSAISSSMALLALVLALRQPLFGYSKLTYLNFLGMGLVSQVLGYLAINYALGHLPATLVSPTLLGQPVITAILAGALLGETLDIWQVAGGLAVLLGVYLVHTSRADPRLPRPT